METIEYKGYTIQLERDDLDYNPRTEFDHMGKMVCCHLRYNLGDEQWEVEDIKALTERDDVVSLPLYLYDHSGITMRTEEFSCPWDSGQVGLIYMTLDQVKAEYGDTSQESVDKALRYMKGEVEEYDHYLTGDVWGYRILDENEEDLGSCWGFFGGPDEDSNIMQEAKIYIDWHIENERQSLIKQITAVIRETHEDFFRQIQMELAGIA